MPQETPTKRPEPTAAEAMFFYAIVKHTRNKADIDWHAVAVEQGFKNAEVAKVRFGQVRRKLGINNDSPGGKTTPRKPATPTKVTKTPTGRGKGKGKKAKSQESEDHDVQKKEEDTDKMGVADAKCDWLEKELPDPF